jgi:hypothetical protein
MLLFCPSDGWKAAVVFVVAQARNAVFDAEEKESTQKSPMPAPSVPSLRASEQWCLLEPSRPELTNGSQLRDQSGMFVYSARERERGNDGAVEVEQASAATVGNPEGAS